MICKWEHADGKCYHPRMLGTADEPDEPDWCLESPGCELKEFTGEETTTTPPPRL